MSFATPENTPGVRVQLGPAGIALPLQQMIPMVLYRVVVLF